VRLLIPSSTDYGTDDWEYLTLPYFKIKNRAKDKNIDKYAYNLSKKPGLKIP
jgi:hypothetical protein